MHCQWSVLPKSALVLALSLFLPPPFSVVVSGEGSRLIIPRSAGFVFAACVPATHQALFPGICWGLVVGSKRALPAAELPTFGISHWGIGLCFAGSF